MGYEFTGKQFQQLRMRGWILPVHLVQGMGESASHQQEPDTVDAVSDEAGILLSGQILCQSFTKAKLGDCGQTILGRFLVLLAGSGDVAR